ncbi:PASTA domain-containing protein [Microtetraspora malaysiensis]|uniref:PASTA domain-containing protein n=1 Tax=Microtetraspora malaysiensis TaxID=161358 RepID=UPI00082DF026|nr:PASTA domain-containing protein [Microtetraspora malaysiensis]
MNVEETLKEAMASRVAAVQAPPSMGQRIRRRSRRNVVRFRTAGAALLTVAVAGAVPVYLSATSGPAPAQVGAPAAETPESAADDIAVSGNAVPNVVGLRVDEVLPALKAAGFKADWKKVVTDGAPHGTITEQKPAAGAVAPEGSTVEVTIATRAAPDPSATPTTDELPQDLGDLGDGRTFGGVHFGYLPAGLEWGKWSGKNGFGDTSYTTTWDEPSKTGSGEYSVQAVVYQGKAARARRGIAKGDPVTIHGRQGYLGRLTEGGELVAERAEDNTLTLVWFPRADRAVEIMMSPTFATKLGDADKTEIQKIAEGVVVRN